MKKIAYLFMLSSLVSISLYGQVNINQECVIAVRGEYPYPNTKEASRSCMNVDMVCVKAVRSEYPYPNTATAAQSCRP